MQYPAVEAFRGGPNLIRVVGHRGARGILPENSMIGFEFLMQTGTPLLEFDVLMTSDMVPVITHNHHLHGAICRGPDKGFLNEEPKVAHLSWAEIQKFDIGWIDGTTAYGQRFPERAQLNDIRIPSLHQLLEAAAQPLFADAKFSPAPNDYRFASVDRMGALKLWYWEPAAGPPD
ncbi:MAG: glycerophosphodiester phosphodiesterase family protein, partial [Paracoccaceae bacterium]